jgi:hypothetical protein
MNGLRKASLILKGSDLTANVNNKFGFTDTLRTTMTWNNIDLRTLLGDMYNQYDYFNLSLNTIASGLAGTVSTDKNMLNLHVRMSGLPWSNCSYNVKSGSNNQYANIGVFTVIPSATQTTQYNNNVLTFGKNQDICNITIDFIRVHDDVKATPTTLYPTCSFYFDIIGVPKTSYLINN